MAVLAAAAIARVLAPSRPLRPNWAMAVSSSRSSIFRLGRLSLMAASLVRSNELVKWGRRHGAARRWVLWLLQYEGALRARCDRAASVHQARSSAKRGKFRASLAPSSPIGTPSAFKARSMGPTVNVLETT